MEKLASFAGSVIVFFSPWAPNAPRHTADAPYSAPSVQNMLRLRADVGGCSAAVAPAAVVESRGARSSSVDMVNMNKGEPGGRKLYIYARAVYSSLLLNRTVYQADGSVRTCEVA